MKTFKTGILKFCPNCNLSDFVFMSKSRHSESDHISV